MPKNDRGSVQWRSLQICGPVTGYLTEGKIKVSRKVGNTAVTDFINHVPRDICRRCSLDSKRSLIYNYV
jgi:hypothetical protein